MRRSLALLLILSFSSTVLLPSIALCFSISSADSISFFTSETDGDYDEREGEEKILTLSNALFRSNDPNTSILIYFDPGKYNSIDPKDSSPPPEV